MAHPPPINLREGELYVRDGTTPTPNELRIPFRRLGFNFTVPKNLIPIYDGHLLLGFKTGRDQPGSGSLDVSFHMSLAQGAEDKTIWEALSGLLVGWVSTGELGLNFALDVFFEGEVPGTSRTEVHALRGACLTEEVNLTENEDENVRGLGFQFVSYDITIAT